MLIKLTGMKIKWWKYTRKCNCINIFLLHYFYVINYYMFGASNTSHYFVLQVNICLAITILEVNLRITNFSYLYYIYTSLWVISWVWTIYPITFKLLCEWLYIIGDNYACKYIYKDICINITIRLRRLTSKA